MGKIIGILSAFLLPAVSFAQDYSFKMMDYGNRAWGYGADGFGSNCLMSGLLPLMFIVPVLGAIFFVALFVFWVLMLIDAIKHSPEKTKLVWVVVIVFTQIIGAFIYYFVEKRPRDKKGGSDHSDK